MLRIITFLTLYRTANTIYFIYPTDLYDVCFGNLSSLNRLLAYDLDAKDTLEPGDTKITKANGPNATKRTVLETIDRKLNLAMRHFNTNSSHAKSRRTPESTKQMTAKNWTKPNPLLEFNDLFYYNISDHTNHHDLLEYHLITQKLQNVSRRFQHDDPEDTSNWFWSWFAPTKIEGRKKRLLSRVNMQWLLHSRYFVSRALRQREEVRNDKRYQLGYLFNRLRRLSYEQLKVYATANEHIKFQQRSVEVLMRFYERIVHLDIDIRDTIDLIRTTFLRKASYDVIKVTNPPPNSTKKPKG